MLADTEQLAGRRIDDLRLIDVFDPLPLVWKTVVAMFLALVAVVLAVLDPADFHLWALRNLRLANTHWPHKIRLEAVDFTQEGDHLVRKWEAGKDFELCVRAFPGDTKLPVMPPEVVEIHDEGGGRPKTMEKTGQPATSATADVILREYRYKGKITTGTLKLSEAAGVALQEYRYKFKGMLSSKRFNIRGGDARLDGVELKVVPPPNLSLQLVCKYPPYMERASLTIDSVSGAVPVQVPIGSRVFLRGTADQPLEHARIDCLASEGSLAWRQEFSGVELGGRRKEFTCRIRTFPGSRGEARSGEQGAGSHPGGTRQRTARDQAPVYRPRHRRLQGPGSASVDPGARA